MVALLNTPELPRNTVICGDCLAELWKMPDCSVDAIVTDPPYGLGEIKDIAGLLMAWIQDEDDKPYLGKSGFMGQGWDAGVPGPRYWREVYRVMKPGAHLLAFSGTRTYDLLVIALRLAGFECRDQIDWIYGAGFPKSMDISKAIDKHLKAEREVIGHEVYRKQPTQHNGASINIAPIDGNKNNREWDITAPATPEATRYSGYGTALKPSHEPICLARKPLSEPTIAQNVLKWNGCGGLNIDKCRIGTQDYTGRPSGQSVNAYEWSKKPNPMYGQITGGNTQGRWPSNTLFSHSLFCVPKGVKRVRGDGHKLNNPINRHGHGFFGEDKPRISKRERYNDPDGMETIDAWICSDDCPVRILGEQSGVRASKWGKSNAPFKESMFFGDKYGEECRDECNKWVGDIGTAARYFAQFSPSPDELEVPFLYASKASRAERNRGCEGLPEKPAGAYGEFAGDGRGRQTEHAPAHNSHPTVKSLQLMKYLCRLVGVPGGVILDPFMGSGSTGVAALQEGFSFIGIEQDASYVEIARARIQHAMQEAGIAEVQGDGEWICDPFCPVAALDRQSGYSKSKAAPRGGTSPNPMSWGDRRADGDKMAGHNDAGGASRFFAQFAPDSLWSLLEDEGSEL